MSKVAAAGWWGWKEKGKKALLEAEEASGQEDAGGKLSLVRQV